MIITIMVPIRIKSIILTNDNSSNNDGDNINIGIDLKNQDQMETRKMKQGIIQKHKLNNEK